MLDRIIANLNNAFGSGLKRPPQEFLYLDRAALYEHFKAITGMNRVPVATSESKGASAGAGIFGLQVGASGDVSTSFDISEPHLFESLEPVLRDKYPEITSEQDVVESLRSFGWFRGTFSRLKVGPIVLGEDKVIEEARLFHTLEAHGIPFCLACDPAFFSPFVPFLVRDPQIYEFQTDVETLAYNTGASTQYGETMHPAASRSLVLVPTVVLVRDERTNQEIADRLRGLNDGSLSRPFGMRRRERETEDQ